jgi:hypothetical protein
MQRRRRTVAKTGRIATTSDTRLLQTSAQRGHEARHKRKPLQTSARRRPSEADNGSLCPSHPATTASSATAPRSARREQTRLKVLLFSRRCVDRSRVRGTRLRTASAPCVPAVAPRLARRLASEHRTAMSTAWTRLCREKARSEKFVSATASHRGASKGLGARPRDRRSRTRGRPFVPMNMNNSICDALLRPACGLERLSPT